MLVTGASGHVGYHLVKLLSKSGYEVKAFIRPASYHEHLKKLPIEICHGDILEPDSIKRALKGVETVFHAAAVYNISNEDDGSIIKTAVEGTKNLLESIAGAGTVTKLVHTSSVEAIGISDNRSRLLDESCHAQGFSRPYARGKIEAEQLVLESSRKTGIDTVICNPSTVIGKHDYKPTPSSRMLMTLAKFRFFSMDSGQSLVHAEDVAKGHVQAMLCGRNRERYILSGENIAFKDLVKKINRLFHGKNYPVFQLSKSMLWAGSLGLEILFRAINADPPLTRERVSKNTGRFFFYNNDKARQELSFSPKPMDEYLRDTLLWLSQRYGG
ncbi:NAD-dependent epimerase/dehydratase family protein [Elusimicrobiota bacterium]